MVETPSWRLQVFRLLEHPLDNRLSRTINYLIISLIVANILVTIFESVAAIHREYVLFFTVFEVVSVLLFTLEYVGRVWSCVESQEYAGQTALSARLHYMRKPVSIIDALAILPFYLGMFFSLDLRFMRFFRLLRIFKLTRYSRSLDILLTVLRNESRSFGMSLFILVVVLLLSAGGIYVFEKDVQPEVFGSIPASLWWAVTTITSVGYGDVTPVTIGGKIFGALVMIVGIGMVALPTGILSSAFSEEIRKRRDFYLAKLDEALADGLITHDESLTLARLREELRISEHEAHEMLKTTRHRDKHRPRDHAFCPCCGKPYDG